MPAKPEEQKPEEPQNLEDSLPPIQAPPSRPKPIPVSTTPALHGPNSKVNWDKTAPPATQRLPVSLDPDGTKNAAMQNSG